MNGDYPKMTRKRSAVCLKAYLFILNILCQKVETFQLHRGAKSLSFGAEHPSVLLPHRAIRLKREKKLWFCISRDRFRLDASSKKQDVVEGIPRITSDEMPAESLLKEKERRRGLLVLLTVPFAWGTFEPAVRYVYAIDPPVPGFVFSLSYYLVAAVSLIFLSGCANLKDQSREWPIQGGVELGFYLFVGNALQVLGLKTVPSDRAAFILQLTTIFVPLMEAVLTRNPFAVSLRTWLACAVALLGVGVMGLDMQGDEILKYFQGNEMDFSGLMQLSSGDYFIIAAALAYTFHCIRLEGYAKATSAVQLAAAKASTETILSAITIVALIWLGQSSTGNVQAGMQSYSGRAMQSIQYFGRESGEEIIHFFDTVTKLASDGTSSVSVDLLIPALAAILWTGWITCAYTIYAQSFGQSRVRPVIANLIYTVQPICTAIFAWVLLGESLGPAGYLGGAIVGFAVLLVATEKENETAD